jgi:hypothetical protein
MKSKKILVWLLQAILATATLTLIPSCASEDEGPKVMKPTDNNVSGLPWNRPQPGEDAQRFGGLPQSR